ncbi:MAG: site-specific DNA-methyltransferase [Bacillota bacterium]|nr:site-specific DNA-methyltransferase [Bacillota bacterium]
MSNNENFLKKLQSLFRELFQFDFADLDFGLYRIFHLKRAEIETFISEQLPSEVDVAFKTVTGEEQQRLQEDLNILAQQVREQIADDAILPTGELQPKYLESNIKVVRELVERYENVRQKVAANEVAEAHKVEVFNHLYNFFSRYYEDGDFISKRRYGAKESYAIPYSGEEVFFTWANRNQHYVKTAETFKDYTFKVSNLFTEYHVRFTMVEASIPKDNTKGNTRYFIPRLDLLTYDDQVCELILSFEYRLLTPEEAERYGSNSKAQEAIIQEALPQILETVANEDLCALLKQDQRNEKEIVDGKPELPLLLKRLRHFCRKNTSDYFIHKDLRGFLKRELEFYIKEQVIHLMDLEANEADLNVKRRILRVFRRLAENVIEFLANIEDAQKILFEKKKFILGVDYLIPIQHIPRVFWQEILRNEGQLKEWQNWLTLKPEEVNEVFLENRPTLTVHTKYFDRVFVQRLLEALPFEDLDEATDGLLVHGENYQALCLLMQCYLKQVKCIYIDPPYNAAESEILYKNSYKHSSWASLMHPRLSVAKEIQAPDGLICVTIDDYELQYLKFIIDEVFGANNHFATVVIRNNPSGRSTVAGFAVNHEYALFYAKSAQLAHVGRLPHSEGQISRYDQIDENGKRFEWENLRKSSRGSLRSDRPKQFFPLYYNKRTGGLRVPSMMWRESIQLWEISEPPDDDEIALYPVDESGVERVWNYGVERAKKEAAQMIVVENGERHEVYKRKYLHQEGMLPRTWWDKPAYSARDNGARTLKNLFGQIRTFDFPKAVQAVSDAIRICLGPSTSDAVNYIFDFFAGSGTTGHAVINLNREDGGQRKFILVEMGEYFDTVLLPRITKVMYTPEWKDGKPKREATPEEVECTPCLVKILRIESYEDTLHNLAATAERFSSSGEARKREEAIKTLAGEDTYRLRYWIELPLREAETCLRALDLVHPFAYTLEILTEDGPVRKPVDVVETFNYLYGLRVRRYETWSNSDNGGREYRVVKATDRDGKRRILVLWRDVTDLNSETERAFLEVKIAEMEANGETWNEILINGDSPTPAVVSLDPIFKRLMMQGEEA